MLLRCRMRHWGADTLSAWLPEYPMRDGAQIPWVEWRSADLRKELIELAKEGLVSKCPHESRIGQAVWRLEVK